MSRGHRREGAAYVDHPIGDLTHAQTSGMAQLLLLLLAGVWVVRVAVEPCLEVVRRLLGELSALFGGAIDEGRGGDRLRGAGRGRGRRGRSGGRGRLGRGEGRGGGAVGGGGGGGGQDEFLIRKGPLVGLLCVPSILLARDAGRAGKELRVADGGAVRGVAEGVWGGEGRVARGRARAGDRGGGPVVGLAIAQIRGREGGHGGGGCTRKRRRGLGVGGVAEALWLLVVGIDGGKVVCGGAGGVRSAGGGRGVRGRPVAGVWGGIGAREGRAAEGVLEGAEYGGELYLWGGVEGGLGGGGGGGVVEGGGGVGHASVEEGGRAEKG